MARPAHPWYRRQRKMWYVTFRGKQTPLGVTEEAAEAEAMEAYRILLSSPPPLPAPVNRPATSQTVSEVVSAFLDRCRPPAVTPGTHKNYGQALNALVRSFGPRAAETLTGAEIERWAAGQMWSSSTQHSYIGTVLTCLKEAGVKLSARRPPKESRGADAVLSDEQFALVLAEAETWKRGGRNDLGNLLRLLRETGSRSQEIAPLTAEAVDWDNACLRLKQHKSRRHGADRVIHFPASAMVILQEQKVRYGTGPLFRTRSGRCYSNSVITKRMRVISAKVGFHATAHGLGRHSFATKALVAGVPDTVVAALLGHKSTAMVNKHYGHVAGQSRVLKEAVEKISRLAG